MFGKIRIDFVMIMFLTFLAGCGSSDKAVTAPAAPAPGVTRTYFIAAEDAVWDFAPTKVNQINGIPFANYTGALAAAEPSVPTMTRRIAFDNVSSATNPTYYTNDPTAVQIGTKYKKTLYFEYTDDTFATRKAVSPEWQHLGHMGPAIRAEVGDTIKVVFMNKTQSGHNYTVHPHGVFYTKPNEGAPYVSGDPSEFSAGNSVAPGDNYTYTWEVPERAGPGPADGPSVMWMYHSHVNEPKDENTGLVGPMIVYAKGNLRSDGTVVGIDREFVMLFKVYDENDSWHFNDNLKKYAKLSVSDIETVILGGGFIPEPNLKHTMNGYLYGNLPLASITMKKGEHVRWYLMSLGTEVDLHTPHWHGNTVEFMGMRTDVVGLLPAMMVTADMVPDNIGTWLFHCHVNDHIKAGMIARYKVDP